MGTYTSTLLRSPQPPNGIYGYNPYPYGGFDPNLNDGKGNGVNTSQASGFIPTGNEAVVDPNAPLEDIFAANRDTINTTGNTIGQEAGNQLGYYSPIQVGYQGAQDAALNKLNETPGFTPEEASAIQGDPRGTVKSNLDAYGQNLSGQVSNLDSWTGKALDDYGQNLSGQVGNLDTWLGDAQKKFDPLDAAVNDRNLGFDPNGTEKQLTDQDVQDLQTSAGTTVGNQFRTAEDTLERQAAAQGNTSPLALAAARQQLVTQEGATAGDAITNARIAAKQAQYGRAAGIEGQREGATQTQAGLKAAAATTEEAAAQAAAGQAGQAGINAANQYGQTRSAAAQNVGKAGIEAANQYGQFTTGASAAADDAASRRAGTVAGGRIAGEGQYRSGVAQQQGLAQQGGQAAQNTQLGAYGTQTSGGNASASGQAGFEIGKASLGDHLGSNVANLFEKGGTADETMLAKVAEHGPEMIVSNGRYRGRRMMQDDDENGWMQAAA